MVFKVFFSVTLLMTAVLAQQHHGGLQQYSAHIQPAQIHYQPQQHIQIRPQAHLSHHQPEPYDDHPKYDFTYKVEDEHTGDYKEHHETRDGHNVQGYYWLLDADGHRRLVEYTVDEHSGFVAKVTREPTGHAPVPPQPQHHVAPLKIAAAPLKIAVAPVKIAVPIAHAPIHAPIRAPAPIHAPYPYHR